LKPNKAPVVSARQNSALAVKDKKPLHQESTENTKIIPNSNNINAKISFYKQNNEARIVKNLPYTKHFDINSSTQNPINNNNNKKIKNEADQKPQPNSNINNKAAVGNSIYNINNIFTSDSVKSSKNSQNDLIKLDQFIANANNNNKNSQINNTNKIKNEEKSNTINNIDKKPAYCSNKGKDDYKDKANSKNSKTVIKDGNMKGSK
jgi:hypothetical protein